MSIIKGGHAIMMKVAIDEVLHDIAVNWASRRDGREVKNIEDIHFTLLFVGRDLPEKFGQAMLETVCEIPDLCSEMDTLSYEITEFAMFGARGNHLVAKFNADKHLNDLRTGVMSGLNKRGVHVSRGFGFNPHVTLAIGHNFDDSDMPDLPATKECRVIELANIVTKIGSQYVE